MLHYFSFSLQKNKTLCCGRIRWFWLCSGSTADLHLPSETPVLLFPEPPPLSLASATAFCEEKQLSKTRLCQAKSRLWLLSVAVSQVAGSTLAICSRADPCSQLEHSWLLSSGIRSIRWEGARKSSLKQHRDEPKGCQHPGRSLLCLRRLGQRKQWSPCAFLQYLDSTLSLEEQSLSPWQIKSSRTTLLSRAVSGQCWAEGGALKSHEVRAECKSHGCCNGIISQASLYVCHQIKYH